MVQKGNSSNDRLIREILEKQDAKIKRYMDTREKTFFFYAGHPVDRNGYLDNLIDVHDMGFDNYPLAAARNDGGFLFMERLLGCPMKSVGGRTDSFHLFCEPFVKATEDIGRLRIDLDTNPVWRSFVQDIEKDRETIQLDLPVMSFGLSLIDWACSLCSPETLFMWMMDDEPEVHHLLGFISDVYIECVRRLEQIFGRVVDSHGFPCVYCSDLHFRNISPRLIEKFVLPQYARIARSCGGMILSLGTADMDLVRMTLRVEEILGCAFDARIPLDSIEQILGRKLFVIYNYVYYDWLDKPTLINGIYCNPIVQSYSRELKKAHSALSPTRSMIIYIQRYSFAEVCAVKKELEAGT